jgi:hypothetical protein
LSSSLFLSATLNKKKARERILAIYPRAFGAVRENAIREDVMRALAEFVHYGVELGARCARRPTGSIDAGAAARP